MRGLKTCLITLFVAIVIIGAGLLAVMLSSRYLDQQFANEHDGCYPNQPNHTVIIQNDKATPDHIDAPKCDTLTITNLDNEERIIAFGPHEDHVAYDGIKEKSVSQNESVVVTLVQTGSFRFHDHIHDEVEGTFTVK